MGLIPCVIRTDNGKIERSRLTLQMAADVPFVIEYAPRGDAHAKPVVESLFGVINDLFLHRLVITTKSNPESRGAHDPDAAAIESGIDADRFERALMQLIYDVYVMRWHGGLRERPEAVLRDGLATFPLRTWQGSADELRRLLRRDEGIRHVERHGISYKGEWYGAKWLKGMLGATVRIKVDEDDVRTLDVYDAHGEFLGVATSDRVASAFGRAVSRWELELHRTAGREFAKTADAEALGRQHEIEGDLAGDDEKTRRAGRRRHHERRRAETGTSSDLAPNASAVDVPAARPVPPTLPLPAPDDHSYDPLLDPGDAA